MGVCGGRACVPVGWKRAWRGSRTRRAAPPSAAARARRAESRSAAATGVGSGVAADRRREKGGPTVCGGPHNENCV